MKILLGATVALLLGALAMSWNGMNTKIANTPTEELARIKRQVEEQNLEIQKLKNEKAAAQAYAPTPPPLPPAPADADMDSMKAELAAKEAELAKMGTEKNKAERNAKLYDHENAELAKRDLERGDPELRRARLISQALLVGRVKEYAESPDVGNIVVIDVLMPEQVQVGSILAIRKNTGILGQIKVTGIEPEGAVGSPMPGFGPTKPEPGDELIVAPQL